MNTIDITPEKIGSGGNTKDTEGIFADGYFKLAFFENDDVHVIFLNEKNVKKVFTRCLMEMLYSDIEFQSIIDEQTKEWDKSIFNKNNLESKQ